MTGYLTGTVCTKVIFRVGAPPVSHIFGCTVTCQPRLTGLLQHDAHESYVHNLMVAWMHLAYWHRYGMFALHQAINIIRDEELSCQGTRSYIAIAYRASSLFIPNKVYLVKNYAWNIFKFNHIGHGMFVFYRVIRVV